MRKTGVMLVAYGAPDSLDAIGPFMRNLMGREPSQELIDSARIRYLTIGGASPLPARAERIAAALERSLSGLPPAEEVDETLEERIGFGDEAPTRAQFGVRVPVAVGMMYWKPTIAEAVERLVRSGADRIVWVSLSPFESGITTGAFRAAVAEASAEADIEAVEVTGYHETPQYAMMLADSCAGALGSLPQGGKHAVVFSAHSLPMADLGDGAYREQLETLAGNVAKMAHLGDSEPGAIEQGIGIKAFGGGREGTPWMVAYQSAGARPGAWLGPSLNETLDALIEAGVDGVAVCPIGFTVDHLETLYDLDVEAAEKMLSQDREFARAPVPNDDQAMIGILDMLVRPQL